MRPIKVMFLLRPVSGGMRKHVLNLLEHLDPTWIRAIVVGPAGCLDPLPERFPDNLPFFPLSIDGDPRPVNDLHNAWMIDRLANENKIDIIHAHGYKAGLLSMLAGFRRFGHRSVLCTFHNPLRKSLPYPKAYILKKVAALAGKWSDRVVTVSEALKREAVQLLRIPDYKIYCVHNGIDPLPFNHPVNSIGLRQEWGAGPEEVVIGTSARLIPQKGIQYLINAAPILLNRYPNLRFVVAGDGPERSVLENQASALGLGSRFIFTGFRTDIPDLLASIDIFIQPSLEEGFSIAALEAMAAGKPVIASAVDGIPEVVTEKTGILIPPADSGAIVHAADELIPDRIKRRCLGEAGRERVITSFTLTRMIESHQEIYEELTAISK